jgi:hypothetical protein
LRDGVACVPERRPGGPETFSEAAIQFCLLIKFLFGLALRQAIGMGARLRKLAVFEDWPVPDYSTLCRRQSETGPWPRWGRASLLNGRPPDPVPPRSRPPEPAGRQHGREDEGRGQVAGPPVRCEPQAAMAQGASGHGHGPRGHPRGGGHTQPRGRQPGATGPSRSDPTDSSRSHGASRSAP